MNPSTQTYQYKYDQIKQVCETLQNAIVYEPNHFYYEPNHFNILPRNKNNMDRSDAFETACEQLAGKLAKNLLTACSPAKESTSEHLLQNKS